MTSVLEVLGAVFSSTIVSVFVVGMLLNYWIKARLEQSIRHEYDKKIEEIRFEMKKREQSALVADLFSKWIHISDEGNHPQARELNRLSFEMSLWLPDDIAIEINKRLKNLQEAKPTMDLLIECRKIIQGSDTRLKPVDLTFFGA